MNMESIKTCLSGKRKIKQYAPQAESKTLAPLLSNDSGTRKVCFYTFHKYLFCGSVTVEASLVVPLFLAFIVLFVSVFEIYRVQALIKTSIHQSAMELGMYAYGTGEDSGQGKNMVSSAICQSYTMGKLPLFPKWITVSALRSTYDNDVISLKIDSVCNVPLVFIPSSLVTVQNNSQVRAWTGRSLTTDNTEVECNSTEMVYISQYESVYHISSMCTHLNLSIDWCRKGMIDYMRNEYGGKYYLCEKCGDSEATDNNTIVFFTEKGDRYHVNENCSGIKRTISLVNKSDISSMDLCERCKNRENQ